MTFWKFNKDLPESEPAFIPTIDFVKHEYKRDFPNWWFADLMKTGILRMHGWAFDFRSDLKKYVVKYVTGPFREVYAPNRETVRKQIHHKLAYILDVPPGK